MMVVQEVTKAASGTMQVQASTISLHRMVEKSRVSQVKGALLSIAKSVDNEMVASKTAKEEGYLS
jgi:hypothetical protein